MATGMSFGRSVVWTDDDMAVFRNITRHKHWYVMGSQVDSDLMDKLTALKGVPPAVKATLIELGEMESCL